MNKVDVKTLTTRKQYLKLKFRPTFKKEKQFRKEAIEKENEKGRTIKIIKNKPIYIGANY